MPLVLLHGGGNDRSAWTHLMPTFAQTHRVVALDLRGFGDSDRADAYSFELMRDDVIGVLDILGADRTDLIGHSMGGTIAWLVAQAQPDRLAHLVVVDTPITRVGSEPIVLGPQPDPPPPFDWRALEAVIAQVNSPDPQWWADLALVTAPTLMLAGGPSSHVRQETFTEALPLLKHGHLTEIPVGHHIHRVAPEAFLSAVLPFLAT